MSIGSLVTGSDRPYHLTQAIAEIKSNYGDTVSLESQSRSLLKFGRNVDVGTSIETVWQTGVANETLPTTNAIDKISSSNAGDTVDVKIYGHTVVGTGADSVFTEVIQTVTLVGQTETALTTDLARVNRAFVVGSTALSGNVWIYEDDTVTAGVPQTDAKKHAYIAAADGQTFKAATTTASDQYLILNSVYASIDRQNDTSADIQLEVREPGGVFRPKFSFTVTRASGLAQFECGGLIVPKNSDVRLRAVASAASVVNGGFQGYYAAVL